MADNFERLPDPYIFMKGDPRGWFERDHHLWVPILEVTKKVEYKLYDRLYFFRLMGTAIVENKKGDFVFRPNIDPEGNVAWKSMEQYMAFRKYLEPYKNKIAMLLKLLRQKYGNKTKIKKIEINKEECVC